MLGEGRTKHQTLEVATIREHLRSLRSRQLRTVRRFVDRMTIHDRERAELVNRVETPQITDHLRISFPADPVIQELVQGYERGEILQDSLGRGSQQKIPPPRQARVRA